MQPSVTRVTQDCGLLIYLRTSWLYVWLANCWVHLHGL